MLETPLISTVCGNGGRMVRNIARHPFAAPPSLAFLRGGYPDGRPRLQRRDRWTRPAGPFSAERQTSSISSSPEAAPRNSRSAVCPESSQSNRSDCRRSRARRHRERTRHWYRRLRVSNASLIATANRFVPPGGGCRKRSPTPGGQDRDVTMWCGHQSIRQVEVTARRDRSLSAYMDRRAPSEMQRVRRRAH
jgi:hypothetical protein